SMGERLYIWPIYFKKSLEEPFSGTGLGRRVQKKVLAETNKKALSLEHAHLLFLNLALQAGWHTALIFLYFYLLTLKKAFKLWRLSQENPLFVSLFAFLVAYLIMSLFEGMEEGTRFTPFWIASGIIWGFIRKYEEKNEKSSLSS
ncbi:MAG: O-antigen ligase family protein, partial [Caldimicrobium sp.]